LNHNNQKQISDNNGDIAKPAVFIIEQLTYGNKKIKNTKTKINNDRAVLRSRLIRRSRFVCRTNSFDN